MWFVEPVASDVKKEEHGAESCTEFGINYPVCKVPDDKAVKFMVSGVF